jgi:alpha,alpha-trehalase
MIRSVYESPQCFDDHETRAGWLEGAYRLAARYYATWTDKHHRAGDTGLSRYFDLDTGPVPELANDTTYYLDVIDWLLAHPRQNPGYLIEASSRFDLSIGPQTAASDCNPRTGVLCFPCTFLH